MGVVDNYIPEGSMAMDRYGQFQDKILICRDCGEEFVFTVSAQQYFAERGFAEEPKRCKACYMEIRRIRRHGHQDDAESDDGDGGVRCPVFRWPPDGFPPRFLTGENPFPDLGD